MPYKDLPDDFRDTHPSVWVDINSKLLDAKRVHQHYNEYLDELEYAGQLGFDGICCNEHHQNGYGLMPSPNLIASTLTRRTTEPAICVMGNSLALYNPPTRVAEEFANEVRDMLMEPRGLADQIDFFVHYFEEHSDFASFRVAPRDHGPAQPFGCVFVKLPEVHLIGRAPGGCCLMSELDYHT